MHKSACWPANQMPYKKCLSCENKHVGCMPFALQADLLAGPSLFKLSELISQDI